MRRNDDLDRALGEVAPLHPRRDVHQADEHGGLDERVKIAVYAIGGLFIALAGVFEFANLNRQGNPTSGIGIELESIAAVVGGGGSLQGGRASVLSSLVGALLMTTLRSGCVFVEVPDPLQKILVGAIILAAVSLDRARAARE